MIPWEKVLTHSEMVRFVAADDQVAALHSLGITCRQDVARRLGVQLDDAPEPAGLVEQLTPIHVRFDCSGEHHETGKRCEAPASRLAFIGCVHEHISAAFLCAPHDADGFDGDKTCHTCTLAGHTCPLAEIPEDKMPQAEALLVEGLIYQYTDQEEREVMWRFWQENLHRLIPAALRRGDHSA